LGGRKKMKAKIIAILVMTLLIASVALPIAASLKIESRDPDKATNEKKVDEYSDFIPGEFFVKFKEETVLSISSSNGIITTGILSIDSLNKEFKVKDLKETFSSVSKKPKNPVLFESIGLNRIYTFKCSEETDVLNACESYENNPYVEYAEPNYFGHGHGKAIPNDANFNLQWGLHNDGTNPPPHPGTADADIDAPEAWDRQKGSYYIIVAMLDTGIDWDHPDLDARIWLNLDETPGDVDDDDGNGFIDDYRGIDFTNTLPGNSYWAGTYWYDDDPMDGHGHGTVNAGIVGAETDNNIGIAGVDWHCRLMAVKVLDNNNWGLYSWWANGLIYAANNGAHVISMSMGGTSPSATLSDAVNYAYGLNCVIVASMGNDNSNTLIHYPARYGNTIAVGATDTDDTRCVPPDWQNFGMPLGGSNFGSHIDVVAPGNWIYSTEWNNAYGYWGGTSMAAPFVSGLAALLLADDPTRTNVQIRNLIRNYAEDQVGNPVEDTPGYDIYYGYGRINADRSLRSKSANFPIQQINQQSSFSQHSSNLLFFRFLERFPNVFPILRQLLGLQ
jgi:subtilisin family serine protease